MRGNQQIQTLVVFYLLRKIFLFGGLNLLGFFQLPFIMWLGISHPLGDCFWNIKTPPNMHAFLWIVSNIKVLSRDNLAKHRHVAKTTRVFCNERECVLTPFLWLHCYSNIWKIIADYWTFPFMFSGWRIKTMEKQKEWWCDQCSFDCYLVEFMDCS